MMNELTKIFQGKQLRIIDRDNETWFAAKDVCDILGIKNVTQTINGQERINNEGETYWSGGLDEDEKATYTIPTQFGEKKINFVNEFGLYQLVLKSRKQEAKQFKRWITHEVLPSIRKTGKYEMGNASYTIEDPIKRAERWIEEQKEKLMLEQRVKEYEPKVSYVDKILESTDAVNITQIAKDYGLTGQKLNQVLHEERVQYKMNGQWLLYGKHQQMGYTKSKTTEYEKKDGSIGVRLHTRWTQKGRLFIHEILKKRGISPLLERNQMNHVG